MPGDARQRAVAPISAKPRSSSDFKNLNLVPSPSPNNAAAMAPKHDMILSWPRYQNGNLADRIRPYNLCCTAVIGVQYFRTVA
jgi:hypothetical protein